jgi:hypothetical protein
MTMTSNWLTMTDDNNSWLRLMMDWRMTMTGDWLKGDDVDRWLTDDHNRWLMMMITMTDDRWLKLTYNWFTMMTTDNWLIMTDSRLMMMITDDWRFYSRIQYFFSVYIGLFEVIFIEVWNWPFPEIYSLLIESQNNTCLMKNWKLTLTAAATFRPDEAPTKNPSSWSK